MSPALENLPTELLNLIIGFLDDSELANLLSCNKLLQRRIEPELYGTGFARNRAMRWGCRKGNLDSIRLALYYGACISTIENLTSSQTDLCESEGSFSKASKVSTLCLAAKNGKPEVFRALIRRGARIDDPEIAPNTLKRLIKSLSAPRLWPLLRLFLEARLGNQVPRNVQSQHNVLSVIPLIRSGAPPALMSLMIEQGANPNEIQYHSCHVLICPLSLAIMRNETSLVSFLISKGANIAGVYSSRPRPKPWHIPVLAAAATMSQNGPEMVALCLAHGADINHEAPVLRGPYQYYYTTPLFAYLDSIKSWDADPVLSPVEGLKFLLESGASAGPSGFIGQRRLWYRPVKTPSSIEFLLEKWGVQQLTNTRFFATIEFLIENDAARGLVDDILCKCDHQISRLHKKPKGFEVAFGAFRILLLRHRDCSPLIHKSISW